MYETTIAGLTVGQLNGHYWQVFHEASGLEAVSGLRQRRFAEQARAELLATGVDFTADAREISRRHQEWALVYRLWKSRACQESYDDTTFEYYSWHVGYGTFVPSARWAAAMRAATAPGSYDDGEVSRLLNEGNAAVSTIRTTA
jgi:hypothetical protein